MREKNTSARPSMQEDGAEEEHAATQSETYPRAVSEEPTQCSGEDVREPEEPGDDAREANSHRKTVMEIEGGDVVDGQLDAEAGPVDDE